MSFKCCKLNLNKLLRVAATGSNGALYLFLLRALHIRHRAPWPVYECFDLLQQLASSRFLEHMACHIRQQLERTHFEESSLRVVSVQDIQ